MDDLLVSCTRLRVCVSVGGMGGERLMVLMRLWVMMLRSERGSERLMRLSKAGR